MAIIDTLRLARALHDRGGFSQEAADATAEALNAALGEDVATKADIGRLEVATKANIDRLDSKLTVMMWAIGINAAATITMLVKLWPSQ
jgi:3-hydroxy-3-methylglutaryl CoA synthase